MSAALHTLPFGFLAEGKRSGASTPSWLFKGGEVASLSSQLISRLCLAAFLGPEMLIISNASVLTGDVWLNLWV